MLSRGLTVRLCYFCRKMGISAGISLSSLLSLVMAPSAYLWPQLAIKASYNIPGSMRGWHQKGEAVTSTCKRPLKSPEVLGITAHHRAVQPQQNLTYSWLPPQPEGGLKAEGSHIQISWKHFDGPMDFMTVNDTRSREAESMIAYLS